MKVLINLLNKASPWEQGTVKEGDDNYGISIRQVKLKGLANDPFINGQVPNEHAFNSRSGFILGYLNSYHGNLYENTPAFWMRGYTGPLQLEANLALGPRFAVRVLHRLLNAPNENSPTLTPGEEDKLLGLPKTYVFDAMLTLRDELYQEIIDNVPALAPQLDGWKDRTQFAKFVARRV